MNSLDRLHVFPPRSPNLGEAMLKSFIQPSVLYNALKKVVLLQPWYQGVAGWFDVTLEPDAYPQYYGW
jgi:hypothetical protein